MSERARNYTWGAMGMPRPESIPHQMPDNGWSQVSQTILVDARNRPILVKEPRPLGFRPPKEKA
jgi:hypothetical protein